MSSSERFNQKQRTRDAIVDAAIELTRQGRSLAITEVAEAARVSPATAYRYFPNPQALWDEVANLNAGALNADAILAGAPEDPAARIDHVIAAVADAQLGDEATWRAIARASLERWFAQSDPTQTNPGQTDLAQTDPRQTNPRQTNPGQTDPGQTDRLPIRGSRRLTMTQQALAALDDTLPPQLHRRLTMSVALVYGVEAMIATRDVCGLHPDEAKEVMRWAAQALTQAALAQAAAPTPQDTKHEQAADRTR